MMAPPPPPRSGYTRQGAKQEQKQTGGGRCQCCGCVCKDCNHTGFGQCCSIACNVPGKPGIIGRYGD